MSHSTLFEFLRRELMPTPGRARATLRLTLACLAATIPILTHHIPSALIVMIVMYLITQEDTAATLLGSLLGGVGVTIGLGVALLAWELSLDITWLRLCFLGAFLFGGLFLKRVLTIGALGSAIGLPAALVMIIPDIFPPHPEVMVEFVLWLWCCVILGLSVNAAVQLLLSPGDPLLLLRREQETRLMAVEQALRRRAGDVANGPPAAPLDPLEIAGMSRSMALLKTASIIHSWARGRREELAAIITLTDRLVTSAVALEALAPLSDQEPGRARLLSAADGCQLMRRAFAELRLPSPGEWTALSAEQTSAPLSPLTDIERTLDEIALALPGRLNAPDASGAIPAEKRSLFLPDAFDNPEYVRFATKGSLAALICYALFIGFDYPGIYTSVITCFVVSLSTIGASNQKGLLRFGGAAVGGGMGLFALVYLFPNVESIGGFWMIFGAGTAVAAWVNFGTPRISYGGYQIGVAFYKAVLQGFGPALSATVVRDRLVGVFFGLFVFGIVEHALWPVRAADALRARLAEMLRLLAELARMGKSSTTSTEATAEVDSWRRRISQKVEDIQGLIESSKFEPAACKLCEIQKVTGEAQIIFILLLSLTRHMQNARYPNEVRAAAMELDSALATTLLALATQLADGSQAVAQHYQATTVAYEHYLTVSAREHGETGAHPLDESLALYRALVIAIKRIASESLNAANDGTKVRNLAVRQQE